MFPSPPAFGILLNAIYCNIKSFVLVFSVAFDFAICWILCDVELCPFLLFMSSFADITFLTDMFMCHFDVRCSFLVVMCKLVGVFGCPVIKLYVFLMCSLDKEHFFI